MNKAKLQRLFVDFILNEVGPSEEKEKERNIKYNLVKQIIKNSLTQNYPNYIPHLFLYGSFSIKTYLKDSDIDITIILENKENHDLLIDIPNNLIIEILQLIKKSFEDYNDKIKPNSFNDINIILSETKLLKCQLDSLFLDISLNNFYGLLKIIFMHFIFEIIKKDDKNKNKLLILKRTIILTKAWFYYESNLIGSNIGLMASCALELLILNIFNIYYENIQDEIDAFFHFFNVMNKINFNEEIITLFGPKSAADFFGNNQKNYFWYIKQEQKYLFKSEEFIKLYKLIEESKNILYSKEITKNMFQNKLCNILDPINESNNLGKSINNHCFSRIKGIFQYIVKEINEINKIEQMNEPFLYINSLLRLFNTCLSMNFIELFINYLNMPKIFISSQNKEHFGNNILKVENNEIKKFNNLFVTEERKEKDKNEEQEEEEEEEEDENKNDIDEMNNINMIKDKYQKFDIIINNKIMNKLLEIYNNSEKSSFHNKLNEEAEKNFSELNDFLKNHKII